IGDLCFLHTLGMEYGCMCRKIKKVGNHQQQRIIYFMIWQNSLLPTVLLIISIIQILLRRASAPTCSGPPPAAEPARPMEKITQARRVTRSRPRHSIGLSQDVIVLKPRLSIHEPGLWSFILSSNSLSEDLAITRSN